MPDTFLQIAVPSPLYQRFDYRLPTALQHHGLARGCRVRVPFGRQDLVGMVWGLNSTPTIEHSKIKPIHAVIDEAPILSETLCRLAEWAAEYYQYPLGGVLETLLPKALREGKSIPADTAHLPKFPVPSRRNSSLALNAEQQTAVNAITKTAEFSVFLLEGITGSGKTEVYLQTLDAIFQREKQALILVPEIGLTPQTIERFAARFSVPMAVYHSGLTDRQRLHVWAACQSGAVQLVIGTRSAVFLPFKTLGFVCVDEEHDLSFKQQTGFRYSARDVAVRRAQLENIPIVLGSATPALASLANTEKGRYHRLRLSRRAGDSVLPVIRLIDLRNQILQGGLSAPLVSIMQTHLAQKQQVLLFLNRRGFAPILFCHACGWRATCARCDATLTVHHPNTHPKLHCHHCDAVKKMPTACEQCHSDTLVPVGLGTEQLEETIRTLFPDKNIVRLDRDNTSGKGKLEALLDDIQTGKADILIGTQMLTKGHHFPQLSLVAVVDADQGLFSSDFRALEYFGQQIVQVAGRAGREKTAGEVLIQTHQPEHPFLQILLRQGYDVFSDQLLQERKNAELPPFSYHAILRAESPHKKNVTDFLVEAKSVIPRLDRGIQKCETLDPPPTRGMTNACAGNNKNLHILGPLVMGMEKIAGRFRSELLLQHSDRRKLQQLLNHWVPNLQNLKTARKVRWALDVDPV